MMFFYYLIVPTLKILTYKLSTIQENEPTEVLLKKTEFESK